MRALQENTRSTGQEGFTLVEVIVSMFLMAIVFTSAFGSYFLGMRIIQDSREEVRASQIIQSELERLRTKNWQQLNAMTKNQFEYFEPQGTFVKKYSKNYTAFRVIIDDSATRKWAVIFVQWKNSRGKAVNQAFSTVFTKDGLNDYYYREI